MNKLLLTAILLCSQSIAFSMSQPQLNNALSEASSEGSVEQVTSFLRSGADVNAKIVGYTPLHIAAFYGYTNIIELLFQAGATVNTQNNDGHTPLHLAALAGKTEAVRLLLQAGADVTTKDAQGKSAGDCTLNITSNDPLRKILKDYQELQSLKDNERTSKQINYQELLINAVKNENTIVIKYLLSNILWSEKVLLQAFQQAKASYSTNQDKVYQEIGRMLFQYLQILGHQGRISKEGLLIPLPEELKQVIASHFFKLGQDEQIINCLTVL